MVKSKSAGYICPSLKEKKVHRFSLTEDVVNEDDAGSSLLSFDCNYNKGKWKKIFKINLKKCLMSREYVVVIFLFYREFSKKKENKIQELSNSGTTCSGTGQKKFLSISSSLCNL